VGPGAERSSMAMAMAALLIGVASLPGRAEEPWRRWAERGVEAFEAGDYERAAGYFDEAGSLAAQPIAELIYNLGCAQAGAGRFAMAEASFRQADRLDAPRELRVRSRFNLGLALLERGRSLAAVDVEQAIDTLTDSSRAFKAAWRLDPGDDRAAEHVEIARRLVQLLKDQLELPERLDAQAASQSEASSQEPSPDTQRQLEDQARQAEQTLEQAISERITVGPPSEAEQARRAIERAQEQQRSAREAMEQDRPDEAQQAQREAAQELQDAAERLRRLRQQTGGQPDRRDPENNDRDEQDPPPTPGKTGDPQQEQQASEGEQGSEPPPDQLVEAMLEKERREREMRDEYQRSLMRRALRVEKDW